MDPVTLANGEIQSKRLTTKKRVKIEKKVREHNRKVKKGFKKGFKKSLGKTMKKDPGVPSMWPMKESFIQKMQTEGEKEKMQRRLALVETARSVDETARSVPKDSSKKAFYREFEQVVEAADVILEVLDARDPLGCRVKAVEKMVLEKSNKRIVLVLNKIDLVPRETVEGWLRYLRREFPAVAFKASTQSQRTHLGQAKDKAVSGCLGADTLIQLLKNYSRSQNLHTTVTVGVVGYPNVGKSSLINSLKRSKVCRVGAAPGVTTSQQQIHLDRNIRLIDCPGIVFSDDEGLLLRNCLKVEQLADPVSPAHAVVARCSAEQLQVLYEVPRFDGPHEFLLHLAKRQGKLRKGGIPDLEAAARVILNDWNRGKISHHCEPPVVSDEAMPTIVSSWASEFDFASITDNTLMETIL